jgi:hypothetical protein
MALSRLERVGLGFCGLMALIVWVCIGLWIANGASASPLTVGTYTALTSKVVTTEVEPSATFSTYVLLYEATGVGECTIKYFAGSVVVQETNNVGTSGLKLAAASFILPAKGKWHWTQSGSCTGYSVTESHASIEGGEGPEGKEGKEGKEGPQGAGVWRGEWNTITSYAKGDMVQEGGSTYISLKAENKNNIPSSLGTWWALLAGKGTEGKEGKEGKEGAGAGGSGKTEVTNFGTSAQMTFSEGIETGETIGWCIIGTLIAMCLAFMTWHILASRSA